MINSIPPGGSGNGNRVTKITPAAETSPTGQQVRDPNPQGKKPGAQRTIPSKVAPDELIRAVPDKHQDWLETAELLRQIAHTSGLADQEEIDRLRDQINTPDPSAD